MLKKVTLHLITAIIIATPVFAKQKVSKEAHQQAIQLQQQGWILHNDATTNDKSTGATTLEQLLDISINHHNQIDPTTNLPKYIIVNATAKASSFEKAYKMALLKARKDIITLKNSNLNNTSQTDITTTTSNKGSSTPSTKQRTISSTHLKTKSSNNKDNILLCAYRTTSATTEVMIILETDVSQ